MNKTPSSLGSISYAGTGFGGKGGFPPTLRLRTAWTAYANTAATTTSGTFGAYANAVYQPSTNFNNNSAFDFIKLSSIYKYYRVYASAIQLKLSLSSTSATPVATIVGGDCCLFWSNIAPSFTMQDAMQQPGSKYVRLSNIQKVLRSRATSKFVLQRDPSADFQLCGGAQTPSQPAATWLWNFVVVCDAIYTNVVVNMDVKITYDVEFFELVANSAQFLGHKEFRQEVKSERKVLNLVDEKVDTIIRDTDQKVNQMLLSTGTPRFSTLSEHTKYKNVLSVLRSCAKGESKEVIDRLEKEYAKMQLSAQLSDYVDLAHSDDE